MFAAFGEHSRNQLLHQKSQNAAIFYRHDSVADRAWDLQERLVLYMIAKAAVDAAMRQLALEYGRNGGSVF
jgi:NAD(P)-dependent dehydrogenase (short-subunit alcohol dehydrogenase family)